MIDPLGRRTGRHVTGGRTTGGTDVCHQGARLLRSAPDYYREGWHKLEDKLLERGGEAVVHGGEPETDLFKIIDRGEDFHRAKLSLRLGDKSACHSNVAALWRRGQGRIVTGYATESCDQENYEGDPFTDPLG